MYFWECFILKGGELTSPSLCSPLHGIIVSLWPIFVSFCFCFDFPEDSMNDIRHQAMIELQKLVLAAENKMIELVAAERTKPNGNRTTSGGIVSTVGLPVSPPSSSLISQYSVSLTSPIKQKKLKNTKTRELLKQKQRMNRRMTMLNDRWAPLNNQLKMDEF